MYFIIILILFHSSTGLTFKDCNVQPKGLTQIAKTNPGKFSSYSLDYYYHGALKKSAVNAFTDVFLKINLTDADSYHFYQGNNCSVVNDLHDSDSRYFGLFKKAAILRSHQMSPFDNTVVGIATSEPYEISVVQINVNYLRVVFFTFGVVLFLFASSLVRNVVFYYASGCSFGVLSSLLLVAFIVYRVAPKKAIGIPILIGGWSVSLYMLHFAWENLTSIMVEYQKYVIGYFTIVLLVSMAVCYKRGPPTDAKAHNIAQWTLQLVAVLTIYFSCQIVEVSFLTYGLLIVQQLTKGWVARGFYWYLVGLKTFWQTMFPSKRKLLTEEEYEREGREFTHAELEKLKRYCKEDANRSWRLVGNVKASRRLARFVEGAADHVTGAEEYEHELNGYYLDRYAEVQDEDEYEDDEDVSIDGDEWDEVVVRRKVGAHRTASVQSLRVPRSVTSKLLNRSMVADRAFMGRRQTPVERENVNRRVASEYRPQPSHRPELRAARREFHSRRYHQEDDDLNMETPLPTHEITLLDPPRSSTTASRKRLYEERSLRNRRSMQPAVSESDDEEVVY